MPNPGEAGQVIAEMTASFRRDKTADEMPGESKCREAGRASTKREPAQAAFRSNTTRFVARPVQWSATETTQKDSLTPHDRKILMMYISRHTGIDDLKKDIADRLRPVCSHLPDDEFAGLIDQIARIEHKYAQKAAKIVPRGYFSERPPAEEEPPESSSGTSER
jgi:hypothetical protein